MIDGINVEFMGTLHPRIYILNEIISKIFIQHFDGKRNGMLHSLSIPFLFLK